MIKTITLIGAGNLATKLAMELQKDGYKINQVYSRTEESAKVLAIKLNTDYTISPREISQNSDAYFIALKDSVIHNVLTQCTFNNKLIIHCSGSLPLNVLKDYSENFGVLYPLQTFSKNREVDFSNIPVFVESNSLENENLILKIAEHISEKVTVLSSEKRKSLHLAAVLSCNFVNHFYALAADYLGDKGISFEVLRPLISETAQKVQEMEPKLAQTGPAVRFDENIINDHLNELSGYPALKELYNSISRSIFELHKNK